MAGPRARWSPRRNSLPTGKDEVAGAAPTECSGTPIQAFAIARALTSYSAIVIARPCACQSPCQNPSPVKRVIDEPSDKAPGALIDNNGFHTSNIDTSSTYRLAPLL